MKRILISCLLLVSLLGVKAQKINVKTGFNLATIFAENNDEIIFTDAETDPFEGNLDDEILIEESQSVIDDVIGTENYDLGHTFGGG